LFPRARFDLQLPGQVLPLGRRTLVMGVLNVTPDSFADGGRHLDPGLAVAAAEQMAAAGADIIDIGGESTRPGATALPADEERARIEPVLRALGGRLPVPLSVDTYKAEVAAAALDLGVTIVNDISALGYDPALPDLIRRSGAALVLMHTRGRSSDMYRNAHYDDVVGEVRDELEGRIRVALDAGIARAQLVADPGLGFAKRAEHSGRILAALEAFAALDLPLLVGPSRKSFLVRATGPREPTARDWATAAAVTAAVFGGAHIVRVHDVRAMIDVVRVADQLRRDSGLDTDPVDTEPR
jgi:dihydropteroate synthase